MDKLRDSSSADSDVDTSLGRNTLSVNPALGMVERPEVGFFTQPNSAVHNFEGTPLDVWKMESIATGPNVGTKDDFPADGIDLRYVYFHKVEMTDDDDGEVTEVIRTVLIDKDGHCFGFVSNGVWQSVLPLLKVFGFKKIEPPMRVKLGRIKTNNKREMLRIVPA